MASCRLVVHRLPWRLRQKIERATGDGIRRVEPGNTRRRCVAQRMQQEAVVRAADADDIDAVAAGLSEEAAELTPDRIARDGVAAKRRLCQVGQTACAVGDQGAVGCEISGEIGNVWPAHGGRSRKQPDMAGAAQRGRPLHRWHGADEGHVEALAQRCQRHRAGGVAGEDHRVGCHFRDSGADDLLDACDQGGVGHLAVRIDRIVGQHGDRRMRHPGAQRSDDAVATDAGVEREQPRHRLLSELLPSLLPESEC